MLVNGHGLSQLELKFTQVFGHDGAGALVVAKGGARFLRVNANQALKVQLVRSGTMTSFTERFEDELTGFGMNIGLKIPFNYDNCNLTIT